jgi:hypothetical protein
VEDALRLLLLPRDPLDDRNIMLEIRAGTGGDEASIWAGDLLRMYERYCFNQGWKHKVINCSDGEAGGYKEVTLEVHGDQVYSKLKYEAGEPASCPWHCAFCTVCTHCVAMSAHMHGRSSTSLTVPPARLLLHCCTRPLSAPVGSTSRNSNRLGYLVWCRCAQSAESASNRECRSRAHIDRERRHHA